MATLQTIDDVTAQRYLEFARRLSERYLTNQQTTIRPAKIFGWDTLGGRSVELTLYPAKPNTGIWFVLTDEDLGLEGKFKDGDEAKTEDFPSELLLKADIRNASYNYSGVLLAANGLRLLYPEHLLGAMYAYGVHNSVILVRRHLKPDDVRKKGKPVKWPRVASMNRDKSRSLRYFETYAIPFWENAAFEVVKAITDAGLKEQEAPLTFYTIKEPFEFSLDPSKERYRDWQQKMKLRPNAHGLVIEAVTDYGPFAPMQEAKVEINPFNFLTQVAEARSLLKDNYIGWFRVPLSWISFLAKIINPEFGYGSGGTFNQLVLPEAEAREKYGNFDRYLAYGRPSEIARHNILDRLGDFALLGSPLRRIYFESSRLRHEGSLQGLKLALEQGAFIKT